MAPSAVTRPLSIERRPPGKPDVGSWMADSDGPRHGVRVTVEKAFGGIGITDADLKVAAKDVNYYEFSVFLGFDLSGCFVRKGMRRERRGRRESIATY